MTKQNTSHAVMNQRTAPPDELDFYPTPPWATRALIHQLGPDRYQGRSVIDPAAGRGHMVRPLKEYFALADGADIHDYGAGFPVRDFLQLPPVKADGMRYDWIVTNPPFKLAEEFALHGLKSAMEGVALLVRTNFLESAGRYNRLFLFDPPSHIFQFVERVPMVKGRYDPKASTATSYCWLVWRHRWQGKHPTFHWIEPSRKSMEMDDDQM